MRAARYLPLALVAALACVPPERPATPPSVGARRPNIAEHAPAHVAIELRAPQRARWLSSSLSPATPPLDIVVTNRSSSPIDVSDLRVHLDAVREGVSFRCANEVGPAPGAREPATLESGESFVFERAIDCLLPLTGRYDVRASVSFGALPSRVAYPLRALALDVQARSTSRRSRFAPSRGFMPRSARARCSSARAAAAPAGSGSPS